MKDDDSGSWFIKLKQFLHIQPRNENELIDFLRDAEVRELIDADTLAMIEGVILLAQMKVRDIMLPKKQMISVSYDSAFDELLDIISLSGHSRFPVTGETQDEIIGILHAKDLLRFTNQNESSFDIHNMMRQTIFVPESKRLDFLLKEFRSTRNHMAIVVDEYGSVAGFVTIEDIIEQIIGDIEDEFDIDEEAYIKAHGNSHYMIKAHTPIEEFNLQLKTNFSDELYDTIGGIVMGHFSYLPKRGDTVSVGPFEFKVINADARRIKLLECIDNRIDLDAQGEHEPPNISP